jgi:hypothetical protein
MAATTRTNAAGHEEALLRILEQLGERVELLEVAVGQIAALIEGASTSQRVSARMPELGEMLRRHEVSNRYPQWHGRYGGNS